MLKCYFIFIILRVSTKLFMYRYVLPIVIKIVKVVSTFEDQVPLVSSSNKICGYVWLVTHIICKPIIIIKYYSYSVPIIILFILSN